MYRAVKCPVDAAAGTQRLARPDFLSLGRCCSVSQLDRPLRAAARRERRASFHKEGWENERSRRARARARARAPSRRAFISPINFVDSGWRKNWVKSRGCISSIFSPVTTLRARFVRAVPFLSSRQPA